MPVPLADLPLLTLPTAAEATDAKAPRLLIIYTGGTVGMVVNNRGELVPTHFGKLDRKLPELRQLPYRLELLALPQLIDSSYVTPADWLQLAQLIGQYYTKFDGFVVL
ncbi:MAG: L-asparaginase 1, partial [Hymenobacter sp.]